MTIPADWQQAEVKDEDGGYTLYQYESAEEDITLVIFAEMGGMEYYSLEEMGAMLCEELGTSLYSLDKLDTVENENRMYRAILRGTDMEGQNLVSDITIFSPYNSIRYYLLFTTSSSSYNAYDKIIDGIVDSFTMTLSAEESYQKVQELRDATSGAEEETPEETEEGVEDESGDSGESGPENNTEE